MIVTTYANQNVACISALTCLLDYDSSFLGVILDLIFLLYVAGFRERIESGEISLGDLASTESDCSSARNKGDLGFFGPGQMQSKELLLCIIIIIIILIINSS